MAFDQPTRNRLAGFVSDARKLLTEEFTRQMQHEYGLDPASGEITSVEKLTALDDTRRETARILRETLEYYQAGKPDDTKNRKETLDRILREQAFTVLNRLCALRLAEARGIILEAVAQGYRSRGFQLYARLAGSALSETGEAYRSYLFSVFDELAVELPPLFDRFSPQGRLFPSETALLKLLDWINDLELDGLWGEDETIGWIYQYFNSKEERQTMRDPKKGGSQAPRNSRELAVRNQFFTPRYVVEFLTDNTLGRIWYEMTQGETSLKDTCRYMVRRPNEIFLREGEEVPAPEQVEENLSQDDLLRQPVYIPHRPLKDPRELKMLDPACGSMHFGLYAFDLFEQIYAEAWDLEEHLGDNALWRLEDLESLHVVYSDKETFITDLPRLIIEHNIHGIDIDPRAVQIAGLSLWLRAQKCWQAHEVKPGARPQIRHSKVVCAEPMSGDQVMLEEFLYTLRDERLEALIRNVLHIPAEQRVRVTKAMSDALGNLVRTVWQEMELAGEAGSLLKIDETLHDAIALARKKSDEKAPLFRMLDFGLNDPLKDQNVQTFPTEQQGFWDQIDLLVVAALQEYAENGGSFQRRLFAGDAALGFAFIDLCRKRYDVILMNPPFGETPSKLTRFLSEKFPVWNKNILCAFIECGLNLLNLGGMSASVMDRSLINKSTYDKFRKEILLRNQRLNQIIDLGWEVLDANVEVSCCILHSRIIKSNKTNLTVCFDLRDISPENKDCTLLQLLKELLSNRKRVFVHSASGFSAFPNHSIVYDLPENLLNSFTRLENLKAAGCISYTGHQLQSERHFRNFWEISSTEKLSPSDNFCHFYNGGEYSRFTIPPREVVRFGRFGTLSSVDFPSYSYRIQNKDKHFIRGVGFGVRGEYLDAHLLPDKLLFSVEGQVMPIEDNQKALFLVGLLNSAVTSRLLNSFAGQHKYSGYVNLLPCPEINSKAAFNISRHIKNAISIKRSGYKRDETCLLFVSPFTDKVRETFSLLDISSSILNNAKQDLIKLNEIIHTVDDLINNLYVLTDLDSISDVTSYAARFPTESLPGLDSPNLDDVYLQISSETISYVLGAVFGRWDIRYLTGEKAFPYLDDPFAPFSANPPGMLLNGQEEPIYPEDIPTNYPLRISWLGVIVDDEGHIEDLDMRVRDVLSIIWKNQADALEQELCQTQNVRILRDYFRKPAGFFADHLKRYTKSRRQAPIYWPLSTLSNSYTLWLYYHRLTDQTLFTCVNDFVDPKLKQVTDEASRLRSKKGRTAADEKELERLTDFERELKDFRAELLRVAAFWKPNLNDGVEITASPLWKLFQYKPWQKRLKETWGKLEAGDYDWAHLAYSIRPGQVREKCKTDKSLAIAHGLETLYVEPKTGGKKKKKRLNEVNGIESLFGEE